jgi:diaminohydroxyphosphoribosylaminopyrimidine deaminase/5-amino-6-(5-phosphoribosylamino)uracil reductase
VLTGIGTVLADDPQLNVRTVENVRQPLRAVVDNALRLPADARLLQQPGVMVYTATQDVEKILALEAAGARVVVLPGADGQVDVAAVLGDLADQGCNEVLVEAGTKLNGSLLQAGLVDELVLYVAPQLLGDMARGIARLGELTSLEQRIEMEWKDVRRVGRDLRIIARVRKG